MIYFFIIFFGLVFGSFMNVLIYRLPRGLSIVLPVSHCPICKSKIKFYDNIPIISFLLLKGRCRNCKNKIPIQYPLVELTFTIILLLIFIKFGLNKEFIYFSIFSFFLVTASFCDIFTLLDKNFETGIIPDSINYTGIVTGFTLSIVLYNNYINSLIGILVGFFFLYILNLIYKIFKKIDGIGGGDMKLLALVGAFLGYKLLLPVLLISSIINIIISLIIIIIVRNKNFPVPFGPSIALGGLITIFLFEFNFYLFL